MTPERWSRQKEVFERVCSVTPGDRTALLRELCGDDESLRAAVEQMLAGHDDADNILDRPPSELHPGEVLADRFELRRLAGEGGMGQVWVAFDRQLREEVAIKTIRHSVGSDSAAADRFKRELQLARRIAHPNVCKVFDLFEDSGSGWPRLFLTMELLAGETLAARLKREGRLTPAEAGAVIRAVAAGVNAAHESGVIHRDLKPANIFLSTGPDGKERTVVTDFGLARSAPGSASGGNTESGIVAGTPDYMAPEQIRGDKSTPATDVYALGLIYFEMVKGQRPYEGRNTLDSWMRRVREGPPKLAGHVADLPPRADAFVAKCLDYEPAARFANAVEAVETLEGVRAIDGEARSWRPALRWTAIACAALLAVWGAVSIGRRWQFRDAPPQDALKWYEDATQDIADGASVRATRELARAIQAAPNFAAAHAALAEAHLELDQATLARESIIRATNLAPDRSRLPEAQGLHIEGISRLVLRDCAPAVDALRRRVDQVDAAQRGYAMVSLARALERCDQPMEARKVLDEASKADPRNAAVLVRGAFLANRQKEIAKADEMLARAESLYRERNNFEGVGEVLQWKGTFETERDLLDRATATLGEAMKVAETTGSVQQKIRVMFQQAIVERKRGNLSESSRIIDESSSLARANDLESLTLQGLLVAGNAHLIASRYSEAAGVFGRALEVAMRYHDEEAAARTRLSVASAYLRMHDVNKAEAAVRSALPFYERAGDARNIASAKYMTGQIEGMQGRYAAAATIFQEVLEHAKSMRDSNLELLGLGALASARIETAHLADAISLYRQATELASRLGRKRSHVFALLGRANAFSEAGRFDESKRDLAAAEGLLTGLNEESARAPKFQFAFVNAENALRRGRPTTALRWIDRAGPVPDPDSSIDLMMVRCGAYLMTHDLARARDQCEGAHSAATRAKRKDRTQRTSILVARLYQSLRGEPVARIGSAREAFEMAMASDAYAGRWRAACLLAKADSALIKAIDVSRILAELRLRIGEELYASWSARPDDDFFRR